MNEYIYIHSYIYIYIYILVDINLCNHFTLQRKGKITEIFIDFYLELNQ